MSASRLITLLTDFGMSDPYAGVMKGIIARIDSDLKVVDITHGIPPQNLYAANFCLLSAYAYFPRGTVHLAVVDPGVGTRRRAIAVELATGFLAGPDNGIFTGLLDREHVLGAVELTNPGYWRGQRPSSTFHGRDIFAPVAAYLALGTPLNELGEKLDPATLVRLDLPGYAENDAGISGCIQYIDHFGNLVTNIPGERVEGSEWSVEAAGTRIPGLKTYGDVPSGTLLALVGSHGFVEISVNGGNACSKLQAGLRSEVRVIRK
ncbi:MAG: S-adenosyl-l-methionine hydroxide adenosyltransferase family protein [Syntrophales bacterium]